MYRKASPWPHVCKICNQAKPIEDFSPVHQGHGIYNRRAECKTCRQKIRKNNPKEKEYARKAGRNYYYKDLRQARLRANKYSQALRDRQHRYSKIYFLSCHECLNEFISIYQSTKYCSPKCSHKPSNRKKLSMYLQARLSDIENVRNNDRIAKRKKVKNLNNSYIKHLLTDKTSLTNKDIPQQLIILKRHHLLLKRKFNKLRGGSEL